MKKMRRLRRRPMSEINVVPYIDVMLVLLVIFMVTAPLITQGVKVNLPQEAAGPIPSPTVDTVVITVNAHGDFYLDIGEDKGQPVDDEILYQRIRTVLEYAPATPVLVRADDQVEYGQVVRAMIVAQAAGVPDVGLITQPPERFGR